MEQVVLATQASEDAQVWAVLRPALRRWKLAIGAGFLAGVVGVGGSFLVTPTFISTTVIIPPQQQQGSALAALASLSSLSGLAGSAIKSPAEQFVALMQSVTIADRLIDRHGLMAEYDEEYRHDARKKLKKRTGFAVGKKEGLITISVEDRDPKRAAAMANDYVDELRRMTNQLAVTEAQQRRVFFEREMLAAKGRVVGAQAGLQESGFNPGALKAEPRSAAESYAKLRAELTVAEVRLQTMRANLSDDAPEMRQIRATIDALRARLAEREVDGAVGSAQRGADYIGRYREFKYQETLLELMTRQYEAARVDESREGALIQVVDPALPAEKKTFPKRSIFGLLGAFFGFICAGLWLIWRSWREIDASGRQHPSAVMRADQT